MFSFSLMPYITTRFFLFSLKQKWFKNGIVNVFIFTSIFVRIIIFSLKCKSDIVFLVFLSLDKNITIFEKRLKNLFNKFTK